MPYTSALTIEQSGQGLVWQTDGYVVMGDMEWEDISYQATFEFQDGEIGIIPRYYHENWYMVAKIGNRVETDEVGTVLGRKGYATLSVVLFGNETALESKEDLPEWTTGGTYTWEARITGTSYQLLVNGTTLFHIEYSGMRKGAVGVYATAGNHCSSVQVSSLFPDGWTSNAASVQGAIVDIQEKENEDRYIYLYSPDAQELYVEQTVSVSPNTTYTLSYEYEGEAKAKIIEQNGTSPQTINITPSSVAEEWVRHSHTFTTSSGCTQVKVRFYVNTTTPSKVNAVQLEPKPFATMYIRNDSATDVKTREGSIVTFPSKNNIDPSQGSMSIWVSPRIAYNGTSFTPVLWEYGDTSFMRLYWQEGSFVFQYGAASASIPCSLEVGEWYHIVTTWNANEIGITVNYSESVQTPVASDFTGSSEVIRFGYSASSQYKTWNGVIDEAIVYKHNLSDSEIQQLYEATSPVPNTSSMLMRATFNYAIGNFDQSSMDMTLAPRYGSPIIVQKEDGTVMRKVSFFDDITGEYRTYNQELVTYDGFSDYVEVSYRGLDTENFPPIVKDLNGTIYGNPYTVQGNRIYLTLTEDEKKQLRNKPLLVTYQLEDSYTVDFNIGVPDSFRVKVGKHDGQPIHITYEGNDFHDVKLATMVELNPLLNPNHEGFLYITRNVEPITSFRVKATPDHLPANGASESLLVVEPLDQYGNFISHAMLEVTAEKGIIIPVYDRQSLLLRDRSGRYLYRYIAPYIDVTDSGAPEEGETTLDHVNVVDKETGIGVQIPITLTPIRVISHTIQADDTIESIALQYGTTIHSLCLENKKSEEELVDYIDSHVGQTISVPLNYMGYELKKSDAEIDFEMKAGYIAEYIHQYYQQSTSRLPEGLGEILDLNGDGYIDEQDIDWIHANQYASIILEKYAELKEWEEGE